MQAFFHSEFLPSVTSLAGGVGQTSKEPILQMQCLRAAKGKVRGWGKELTGRSGDDSEVSRLGNWVDVVLLPNMGNAGEEGVLERTQWVQHWTYQAWGNVTHSLFEHEVKRIQFLSWIPYLKKKEKAIKDNLSQALEGPRYRTWNFIHGRDLKIHVHQSPHFTDKLRLRKVKSVAQSHTSSVMK